MQQRTRKIIRILSMTGLLLIALAIFLIPVILELRVRA